MGLFIVLPMLWVSCGTMSHLPANDKLNDVMLQAFYWDVPVHVDSLNGFWWDNLTSKVDEIKDSGISALWTPVPAKGNWGIIDNGYGIYDHYDLGSYNQKGSVETRFGSREELERMLATMHNEPRIDVYSDVVLNHMYGGDENEEPNPAVKAYVFGHACGERYAPYPSDEIKWVVPEVVPGDYVVAISGYGLPWDKGEDERWYELSVNIVYSDGVTEEKNVFNGIIKNPEDSVCHSFRVKKNGQLTFRLSPCHMVNGVLSYGDSMAGYYPSALWQGIQAISLDKMEAYTKTAMRYPLHSGVGEPNYHWNYTHFHPSSSADWLGNYGEDEVATNTKFYGNDLDTFNPEVKKRLKDWGKWLLTNIGFDGFRLDFVRGFQPEFVGEWIKDLPDKMGERPFVVGEYWGSDEKIKQWVESVAYSGANVSAFDFPLKEVLTDMCNDPGNTFDMKNLDHAGLVRNDVGNNLPGTSVVTFLDNHDTGKEHDKWVTKDYHLGYAYILTHEGRPCVFYPHFFGDTQYDSSDPSKFVTAPTWLKDSIKELINVRKKYLGGVITVLSEQGNPYPAENCSNVYIARRQGNGIKDGAIIVLNNHDTSSKGMWVTVNADGFSDWSGKKLVNVLNTTENITVQSDGRVELSAPARSYSIWVLEEDL